MDANTAKALQIIEIALNKANVKGCFELGESYAVKTALEHLKLHCQPTVAPAEKPKVATPPTPPVQSAGN